jgi:hypothetical protein
MTTHNPCDLGIYANVIPGGGSSTNGGAGGTYSVFGDITNNTWSNPVTVGQTTSGQIHVRGDAVFEGSITWQDRDLREWFESVEARLAILRPNPDLEAEWSELAELRMKYVELERQLLEKQQVFDILKQS